MPWSGDTFTRTNGVFTGSGIWAEDRDAGVKIRADRHDTHDQDLAEGINAALRKNGANSPSANLPMGGFRHTNVDEAEARNEYAVVSQIQDGDYHFGTDTGSADAYSIGLDPAVSAFTNGMLVVFRAGATNTGASTLDVNGVGAQDLVASGGAALQAGQIVANDLIAAYYDATDTQWVAVTIPSLATQAEAEAGTDGKKLMTPERTEQAIQDSTATESKPGVAEIATQSEFNTGTDDERFVTAKKVKDRIFESAEQTITNGAEVTAAHGFASTPLDFKAFMICKTTELGYAVDDVVDMNHIMFDGPNADNFGVTTFVNATNVGVQIGAEGIAIHSRTATNGNLVAITNANWRIILRASPF